jgi:hypothetical protein
MGDFADRYVSHFTEARIPNYIGNYIAKVQFLRDKVVLNTLVDCVEGMLEGTLSQQRYDISKSVHLKTVFSGRDTLFEEWQKGAAIQLENFLSSSSDKAKYNGWTLVDTDNGQDLFLCGTEVEGSCQGINGKSEINKYLMAYVIDGKNRLLAIKDSSGRIIARHILRILWDGKKTVLMLEQRYPAVVAAKLQEALKSFAIQRAWELGLPLVNKEPNNAGPVYPLPIQSLGSNAPFEYCDNSSSGGVTRGVYQFAGARRMELRI